LEGIVDDTKNQGMNSIICPNCKQSVEISEAITHQMREQLLEEQEKKHKLELEKLSLEVEERATKKAKQELELRLKTTQEEADISSKRAREFQEQLLQLMKQNNELKQKDSEREIEMKKQLLKERELMEMQISKDEQEKARLDKMELQKQLDDTKKALEDAQRKAQQSSQQLRGEVLELDLENQLREAFATDDIVPVPKGIDGADVVQKVRNKFGNTAGSIVWETKRTKAWSNGWPAKLREDVRSLGAETAILVSDILPEGIETFAFHENIWVTCYKYAIPLAHVLRISMLKVAQAKAASANKDEKLEMLYQYLTDTSFRHRFEAQVEAVIEMKNDLDTEQRSMARAWKKREMQIQRMTKNIANLYGELQGILGSALPSLPGLEIGQIQNTQLGIEASSGE
jgi:hypothetical protein